MIGPATRPAELARTRDLLAEVGRALAVGAPLPEALRRAAEGHPDPSVRRASAQVAPLLAEGHRLGAALARVAPPVAPQVVAFVAAAERPGLELDACVRAERLAETLLEGATRLRAALVGATWSLGTAAAVATLLGVGILPAFVGLVRADLPSWCGGPTHWALAFGLAVLAGAGTAAVLPKVLPLATAPVGALFGTSRSLELALAVRSLAGLLDAGAPGPQSLRLAAACLSQPRRAAWEAAAQRAEDGEPLDRALAATSTPETTLLAAALSGPATRVTPALLRRVADFHEAEGARDAEAATATMSVVAIVLTGLVTGSLLVAAWWRYFSLATEIPW